MTDRRFMTVLVVAAVVLFLASLCCGQMVTVARVIDGDTFDTTNGERIRLQGVDAPEMNQPGGPEAKAILMGLIADRQVVLSGAKQGAWDRTQAYVKWRQWDIGATMLARGWAWVDQRYVSGSVLTTYRRYQDEARTLERGLWVDPGAVPPWDWRRGAYSSLIAATPSDAVRLEWTPPRRIVRQPVYIQSPTIIRSTPRVWGWSGGT